MFCGRSVVGPFSIDNVAAHPIIQKVSEVLDLDHCCGYISMLNTTINTRPYRGTARLATISSPDGSGVTSRTDSPSEPIIDSVMSFVDIGSEDIDGEGSVDCRSSDDMVIVSERVKAQDENTLPSCSAQDWVPLDLCFGVPLFDSDLSDRICQTVRMLALADYIILCFQNYFSALNNQNNFSGQPEQLSRPTRTTSLNNQNNFSIETEQLS